MTPIAQKQGPANGRAAGATAAEPRRGVVLLVDDNAADADLTREALTDSSLVGELHVVSDGLQAIAFLRQQGAYRDAPLPHLILLDLNMPRLDGRGVLAEVKQDPAFRDIPVVVLSSSAAYDDVQKAYSLRANCYVTKPVGLGPFLATIRAITQFWIGTATLPGQAP